MAFILCHIVDVSSLSMFVQIISTQFPVRKSKKENPPRVMLNDIAEEHSQPSGKLKSISAHQFYRLYGFRIEILWFLTSQSKCTFTLLRLLFILRDNKKIPSTMRINAVSLLTMPLSRVRKQCMRAFSAYSTHDIDESRIRLKIKSVTIERNDNKI